MYKNLMSAFKKSFLFIFVFIALFSFAAFSFISHKTETVRAQTSSGTRQMGGLGWSYNVGWVSFRGIASDGTAYGVNVDASGNISGRAWSNPRDGAAGTNNIGFLSFNRSETGNPPSADVGDPDNVNSAIAKFNTNNTITGWARYMSSSGGWDGWVRLASSAAGGYGPVLTSTVGPTLDGKTTKYLLGNVWGADVVGWLSMRGTNYGVYITDPCDPNDPACDPGDVDTTVTSALQVGATCSVEVRWTTEPSTISSSYSFNVVRDGTTIASGLDYRQRDYIDNSNAIRAGGNFTYKVQTVKNGVVKDSTNTRTATVINCTDPDQPPTIGSFTALPPGGVAPGEQCTLRWTNIRNMRIGTAGHSCVIRGPDTNGGTWEYTLSTSTNSSTLSPRINASSRYTLTCTNGTNPPAVASDTCRLRPEFQEF
jgi:hypothetical protein